MAQLIQISHENMFAQHNYFNVPPDSPSGKWVAYTAYPDGPYPELKGPAEVWVCSPDGSRQWKLADVQEAWQHVGARPTWVGDNRLAWMDRADFTVSVFDLDTKETRTYSGQIDNYCEANDLLYFPYTENIESPVKGFSTGIWSLHLETGETKQLVNADEVHAFDSAWDSDSWKLAHAYCSPNATRLAFAVFHGQPSEAHIITTDLDGGDLQLFGPKPMHWSFFDDESLFGHDDKRHKKDKHLRRWDLQGNIIEELAGYGCHGALSPDRNWIVTESWYWIDPVEIYLYRRGQTTPTCILAEQPGNWELKTHVHPAFSRDGTRVYFNYNAPGSLGSQLYACDLHEFIKA